MITLLNCGAFSCSKEDGRENQDSVLLPQSKGNGYILAVADGVGSYEGAKEIADLAVYNLSRLVVDDVLDPNVALSQIKKSITDYVKINTHHVKAATTLSYCYVDADNLHIVHVGDTRIYLKVGDKLKLLTKDHTQHQELMDEKIYTKKELSSLDGKNTLTSAISKWLDLKFQHLVIPFEEAMDNHDEVSLFIMSDGAHSFWEKRPRLSINTISSPSGFSSSLMRRILRVGADDDFSLVAAKFKR